VVAHRVQVVGVHEAAEGNRVAGYAGTVGAVKRARFMDLLPYVGD